MSQTVEKVYDLIISGAGIPGASLALGAARLGLSVALLDRRASMVNGLDTRTTAFLPESLHFLDTFGLIEGVQGQAQPLTAMQLMDDRDGQRDQPERLNFTGLKDTPLALNIPNQALAPLIAEQLHKAQDQIHTYWNTQVETATEDQGQARLTLADGTRLTACLAVAADGRASPLRESLNIAWRAFSDTQTALTARLRHTHPHQGISTDFHRHAGPMTFVPVAGDGHNCALVWCLSNAAAEHMAHLDDDAFRKRVQIASRNILGDISAVHSRGQFPVRPGVAAQFSKGPFVLMAEAAHVLPPLLAQGLNLSVKDVEVLLDQLQVKGPTPEAAAAYAQARWPDIHARLGISEGLNQFLCKAPAPLSAAYGLGHRALQASAAARRLAVKIGQRGHQL